MTALGSESMAQLFVIIIIFYFALVLKRAPTCVRKSKANAFDESINTAGIYLLKVNNRNTRTRCEICSQLTIKTPKRRQQIAYFRSFQMVSDCFSLFFILVGTPLIQLWRSFFWNTFNVYSHAQNTGSKNTVQILQSAELVTHDIGRGID